MLQRLYVHNFRCLQNFEIKPGDNPSLLLIGKNGSGKSTLANALWMFQKLGAGTSRMSALLGKEDFTLGRTNEPMRFEIAVALGGQTLTYALSLDMPPNFKELRISEESLTADGQLVYSRQEALVTYNTPSASAFSSDWHTVALPLLTEKKEGPLHALRSWLQQVHILAPIPQRIGGASYNSPEPLTPSCENFADYLTALLIDLPASYGRIQEYLGELIPDLKEFNNELIASDTRMIKVLFGDDNPPFSLKFDRLSDGEKCMFLCAVMLAVQKGRANIFLFWDEPDNYLALPEIEHFIRTLRQNFSRGSQLWVTSHNEETINCFSHENTLLLRRKDHCAPVEIRPIHELIGDTESTVQKLRLNELN